MEATDNFLLEVYLIKSLLAQYSKGRLSEDGAKRLSKLMHLEKYNVPAETTELCHA